jgi:hypothetical protein
MSPDKPKIETGEILDEGVLESIEIAKLKDDYTIQKWLKYSLLFVVILVIFVLALVFLTQVIINKDFRLDVLNLIKDNITVIIVAGLGILGISLKKN